MDTLNDDWSKKKKNSNTMATWLGRGLLTAGLLLGVGFAGCATDNASDKSGLEENRAAEAPCETPQCDGTPPNPQSKTQPSGPMGGQQNQGTQPPPVTNPPQQTPQVSDEVGFMGPAPDNPPDLGFGPSFDMGPSAP